MPILGKKKDATNNFHLITQMVKDFSSYKYYSFCDIIREADGLALVQEMYT